MVNLNIKKWAVLGLMTASFTACDLDVIPPSDISAESFWTSEKDAWYGLNACYAQGNGFDIWDEMCTDNAHSHKPWEGPYESIQQSELSTAEDCGYSFGTVRIVNNFLEKVDKCEMDETLKERMKAEARFFRAQTYLDLTTKFGKVPLVTTVMEYDAPNVPRDPVEKVQAFILDELAAIATVLPDKYNGGYLQETGRITRAAALAMRARAALYFGNYKEAEVSANTVISEGHHSLFRVTALNDAQKKEGDEMAQFIDFEAKGIDKDAFVKGLFSYETLWQGSNASPSNPEYILTREYMADDNNYDWARYTYIRPSQMGSGYSSYEPMQDLVDAYWDIDGKTVRPLIPVETRKKNFEEITAVVADLDQSGYIKKVPEMDLKKYAYMEEFRNRDSRLYASIQFPFKGWHETDFAGGTFYYRWKPEFAGLDGNESWTGYSYRKMVALTPYSDWTSADDYPVIRYAEVLLTFAEARIANSGWDGEVQAALNDLRDRCGMPSVPTSMPSKEAALDFVRNERRIELAGEGHRFDDIRRYGSAYCQKVMNTTTYAPNGYKVIEKKWNDRILLMPIPQNAMDLNPLLKEDQNPGY